MVPYFQSFLRRHFNLSRPPLESTYYHYYPKVLSASVLISSLHSRSLTMDHQIRAEQPSIEPAYWLIHYWSWPIDQFPLVFGLGLQFRSRSVSPLGAREEPLPLSYQAESTHTKECVGWREMGSESQEESITSLQTKGERSLVDGDEFQSLRKSRAALALCMVAMCYVGDWSPLIPSVQFFVLWKCECVEIQVKDRQETASCPWCWIRDTEGSYSRSLKVSACVLMRLGRFIRIVSLNKCMLTLATADTLLWYDATSQSSHTQWGMPQKSNLSSLHNPLLPSFIYSPLTLHCCCLCISPLLPPPPNTPLYLQTSHSPSIHPFTASLPVVHLPPSLLSVSVFLSHRNNIPWTNCKSVSR